MFAFAHLNLSSVWQQIPFEYHAHKFTQNLLEKLIFRVFLVSARARCNEKSTKRISKLKNNDNNNPNRNQATKKRTENETVK